MNVAFLVSIPVDQMKEFAGLVEDDLNSVGGRLVFVKADTEKLFITRARKGYE